MEHMETFKSLGPLGGKALHRQVICRREAAARANVTLQKLALRIIAKSFFNIVPLDLDSMQQLKDTFECLPRNLKQMVLSTFAEEHCKKEEPLPDGQLTLVDGLLRLCTEVDVDATPWKTLLSNGDAYMGLVLQVCPRLQGMADVSHIKAPDELLLFSRAKNLAGSSLSWLLPSLCNPDDPFLHKPFQLRVLHVHYNLPSIQLLQNAAAIWQHILLLEISMPIVHLETFYVSINFQGLEKLQELRLNVLHHPMSSLDLVAPKLLEIVRHLTSLAILDCNVLGSSIEASLAFAEAFDQERTLTLRHLRLGPDFPAHWPPLLYVMKLELIYPEDRTLEQLRPTQLGTLCIKTDKPLRLIALPNTLAEKVTHLTLRCGGQAVDLNKEIASAPRLKELELNVWSFADFVQPALPLDTNLLRGMKVFRINAAYASNVDAALDVFEAFLLHSEEWDELDLTSPKALAVACATLQQYPKCAVRARRLRISSDAARSISLSLKLAGVLMIHSPVLEKVEIERRWCDSVLPSESIWILDLANAIGIDFQLTTK